jgi:hypothetical protein
MKQLSSKRDEHVLVNRILDVSVPIRLNGACTTVDAYVTSEPTACNYFSESVDVGTIRKCGCHLTCANDPTVTCASRT